MVTEAAPVLCQVVFHQDEPGFLSSVLTGNAVRTSLTNGAGASYLSQSPTKITTPESAIPSAIGGVKSISNPTQPIDSIGIESELYSNRKSDIMLEASSGMSDSDSYYSDSSNKLIEILDNRT